MKTRDAASRCDRPGNQSGFSLMELMVAVMVLGIVLAAATPAFVKFRTLMIRRQACGQIIEDLRAARQLAVTQRMPVIVQFGNGTTTTNITTYKVHADKNNDRAIQSSELVLNRTLPKGGKLSKVSLTPVDSLRYDFSGLLKSGTKGGFMVVDASGKVDTLFVSISGMVYRK